MTKLVLIPAYLLDHAMVTEKGYTATIAIATYALLGASCLQRGTFRGFRLTRPLLRIGVSHNSMQRRQEEHFQHLLDVGRESGGYIVTV